MKISHRDREVEAVVPTTCSTSKHM